MLRQHQPQTPEGIQSSFTATLLQQPNCSDLRQAQGQGSSLTSASALPTQKGANSVPDHPQLSSCTGITLVKPACTMRCCQTQLCVLDAVQAICHSGVNCQAWTPITGPHLTVLQADHKEPCHLNSFLLKASKAGMAALEWISLGEP